MAKKTSPTLTGGTFFMLLFEATWREPREHRKWGQGTGITEEDVFEQLIKVAVPSCNQRKHTSQYNSKVSAYKYGSSKSGRFSIDEQPHKTNFNNTITQDYQQPLGRMVELIEDYLDICGKQDWLVRALLDLICEKKCIDGDVDLYICEDGGAVKATALSTLNDICLPSFLLGIWHFIVCSGVSNADGKETADDWCKPHGKNKRHPFSSDIGQAIDSKRKLNIYMPVKIENDTDEEEETPILDDEPTTWQNEYEMPDPEPIPTTMQQINIAPAVVVNQGGTATITQFNNATIETINFGRGRAK